MVEQRAHLHRIQRLHLTGVKHHRSLGNIWRARNIYFEVIGTRQLCESHTEINVLLLLSVILNRDTEILSGITQIIRHMRRQYLPHWVDIDRYLLCPCRQYCQKGCDNDYYIFD